MHEDGFTGSAKVVDLAGDGSGDGKPAAASVLKFGIDELFQLTGLRRRNRWMRGRSFGGSSCQMAGGGEPGDTEGAASACHAVFSGSARSAEMRSRSIAPPETANQSRPRSSHVCPSSQASGAAIHKLRQ